MRIKLSYVMRFAALMLVLAEYESQEYFVFVSNFAECKVSLSCGVVKGKGGTTFVSIKAGRHGKAEYKKFEVIAGTNFCCSVRLIGSQKKGNFELFNDTFAGICRKFKDQTQVFCMWRLETDWVLLYYPSEKDYVQIYEL